MKYVKLFEAWDDSNNDANRSYYTPGKGFGAREEEGRTYLNPQSLKTLDMDQEMNGSFIVLTGSQGDGSYALSHVKDVDDVNIIRQKFSEEDGDVVFDAIPYTGKNYVGSGFDGGMEIKLTEYETPEEGIELGGYYQFLSGSEEDQDKQDLSGGGEGILWRVPAIGFTYDAQWGGTISEVSNEEYFNM